MESEKWRHMRNSVEIAWTNEQKADLKRVWRHVVVKKILITKTKQEKTNNLSYSSAANNKSLRHKFWF